VFEQIRACLNGEITDDDVCNEIFLNTGIMAELEAINLYETMAAKTENEKIKELMRDISDEERVHVGEFKSLLYEIKPKTLELEKQGEEERLVV
jgi:rubrerythrin